MLLLIVFSAALLSAAFNGSAVILEKIGIDQQNETKSSHISILWKLKNNIPYILGLILDFLSWLLALFAVQKLPLFVVQPIIACSIIFTVTIEHYLLKKTLSINFALYLTAIVVGLIMIASVAKPERAILIGHHIKTFIILGPIILTFIGIYYSKVQKKYSSFILAAITGLSFGGIDIAGRALVISTRYSHLAHNPLIWAIIGYGIIGIPFLTIALERSSASAVNAIVIACESIIPIIFGLLFFNDHPKNNLWIVVFIGIILTISGTILVALKSHHEHTLS